MEFDGNKNLASHELFSVMETREGDHFIPNMLERDMGAILQKYEQAGYPLAKAIVKNVFFSDSVEEMATSIKIMIEEGPAVHISELRVEGNKTTKDYVITREARIRENELFCGDLPERIKRRIDRLQLFTSVSLPELYLTDVGAGLFVQVVEGNQNYFDGVLGYLPSNRSDESGYLTGLVDIQLRNLLGTGRKLAARWYQENRNTQEIELHYFEPWIASYPVNAQLGFFQRKQDSTFVRMQYDIAADLMVTEEFSVGTSFSQTNVFPSERYGRSVMAESNTKSFGASVRYDSRDNPVTPTSGVFYSTQYHTGTKQTHKTNIFTSDSKFNTQRVEFDLSYFFSPILQQVIAAELHIRSFSSSNIDASDLFHFGGATTLRGYREGQFLGSRIVWSNLEYRFLVALRSFFYGFIDLGYIIQPENVIIGLKESEQSKIGYGIGVRMDSILGLIGVSFAFGEGDTFSTSKIHIRLINEF
jgi:outer membrane protein insertion porin family